jgi:exosortase A-associated hydrolase 2
MSIQAEPFFLPAGEGQRFCLFYQAEGQLIHGHVLYIHPFVEEMNKARRMAALQSRALAQAGFNVMQMDLLGCGDSAGDFGDATWQSWVDDVVQGCRYLQSRSPGHSPDKPPVPLWLWGLRAGCLLATQAAGQSGIACNFLFWQAPSLGQPLLNQFMRLKLAAGLQGAQTPGVMKSMRQQLDHGEPLDIAGYRLSAGLTQGLGQAALAPPVLRGPGQRLEWFELSTLENASPSVVATERFAQWQQAGFDARLHMTRGPAFWQSTEIEEAPALISATTAAVRTCSQLTALKSACP